MGGDVARGEPCGPSQSSQGVPSRGGVFDRERGGDQAPSDVKGKKLKRFADRFPMRDSAILEILADNVPELRKASGLSQASLAVSVEIEQTEISKIENRRANPTIVTLERLADALGVPLPALLEPEARQKKMSRSKP